MNQNIHSIRTGSVALLLALACIIPSISGAQSLTLYDAVAKTMANYPQLRQRQAEVAAGRAHVTTVNGARLPSLILQDQATLGSDNSLLGAYFSMGMVPSTPGSYTATHYNPNPGNTAISFLQWEFYTFGYYNAREKEAKSLLAVNEANLAGDQYLLAGNIVALYLDWLKKYRLLQIQSENVERAQVMLTSIRATVLSGLKPGVDSSTASAAYAEARIGYLQALTDYSYDSINILTYTGLDSGSITPDTSFLSSAIANPGTQVATQINCVPITHPLLDIYEKQYEQQLAGNHAISKKYMPKVGLDAAAWARSSGISASGVYPDNLSDASWNSRYNYLFGVNFSYNLFDARHRRDELAEGRFAADARKEALQTQQLSLNNMVRQANDAYKNTMEKLKALPVQLQSAKQAYGQQMALYRAGLNTLIDVTNAQYALLQAESNYVVAQDELLQILYMRAALGGESEIFLQNFKK